MTSEYFIRRQSPKVIRLGKSPSHSRMCTLRDVYEFRCVFLSVQTMNIILKLYVETSNDLREMMTCNGSISKN